jgi:subtilase family serine protease
VPALGVGASSFGSTSLVIPASTPSGAYYVIAQSDGDGVVEETQETNNTRFSYLQIGSDLAVTALSVPGAAGAGATISVTDTTKNQGGGTTAASTTRFYLSTNYTLDGGDVLLSGTRAVPALGPGASSAGSTAVGIPAGTAVGSYYLIAQADADDVVVETYETNNTRYAFVKVGPDLIASSLIAPSTSGPGVSITVTQTTYNLGGGAAGASTTTFYLSTNYSLDAADVLLEGTRSVPALAAGASNAGSTVVTIPAGTAVGGYFLLAVADGTDAVLETTETNNVRYAYTQVGPDLIVSALSVPANAPAGAGIAVAASVKNQGGGAAAPSTVRYYLSTDTFLGAGDVLLDGSAALGEVAPGATASGSTTVTIPAATTPGSYYVIAVADADGAAAETTETNNTRFALIRVDPGT